MELSGIQIFKMLPKKNCRVGCPTCIGISYESGTGCYEINSVLTFPVKRWKHCSEATAPPMKIIKVGRLVKASIHWVERLFFTDMRKLL